MNGRPEDRQESFWSVKPEDTYANKRYCIKQGTQLGPTTERFPLTPYTSHGHTPVL